MNTKQILKEWKSFIEKGVINEISIKRFQAKYPQFDISRFSPQLKGNTDYLDIISNSINAGENHGPDDYAQQFEFYKNSIEPNRHDEEFLFVSIPGDEDVSLLGKLTQNACTATYNDIQQFQQARMYVLGKGSKRNLTAAYSSLLSETNNEDFELIVENSKWTVFYPKSIKGSIALARSYWDGSKVTYDETFNASKGFGQNTGRIGWCTSVSGGGNMFNNYHRRLNLHMYYCINKSPASLEDPARKLCISLSKQSGNVSFKGGTASVNGDNSEISEEDAKSLVGSIFEKLLEDASNDNRLEIDFESYYRSISFEQYLTMRAANEDNIEDFSQEFQQIIKYSKDKEKIVNHALNEDKSSVMNSYAEIFVASDINSSPELLRKLAYKGSPRTQAVAAMNPSTPLEAAIYVASNSYEQTKSKIAKDPNARPEVLSVLSKDRSIMVLIYVAKNPNTSQEDLLKLTAKNDSTVNSSIASNKNISREVIEALYDFDDLSTIAALAKNPNTPTEILADLANHENKRVIRGVAENMNTHPDVLSDIALRGEEKAKSIVAKNPNTPRETLTKLSMHPSLNVKSGVARNLNTDPKILTDFAKSGNRRLIIDISSNPSTPYKVLASLATYGPSDAKELVANNPTYLSKNEKVLKNFIKILLN